MVEATLENRLLKKTRSAMGRMVHEIPRRREDRDHSDGRDVAPAGAAHAGQDRLPKSTFYSWLDRYAGDGLDDLEDRKPRPRRVWNRIGEEVRRQVIDLALDEPELSAREGKWRWPSPTGSAATS